MSVLLDEDTIFLEDLDFAPSCEECDAAPVKAVRCRKCDDVELLCAHHAQALVEEIERITSHGLVVHEECGQSSSSVDEAIAVVAL
ncbi:hypothetical protein [Microbacterium sp. MYb64]|uniref:hypothetical protein n=1 Tax=Microbacterium sp. MYb64 TaxID=1848691 RepID=UPI000CFD1C4E|nr:hypothetical protein [Microbacterium sp. MYb64]PRB01786.1 hypothetical protein CQ044_16700 [Microbacterium sp. MYb64]